MFRLWESCCGGVACHPPADAPGSPTYAPTLRNAAPRRMIDTVRFPVRDRWQAMRAPLALLKAVGKGVLNAVGFGVLGEVVVEVLPEVAEDVYVWWKGEKTPEQQREELERLAQAPASEVREE